MGDFKPENFLLQPKTDGWQISGAFDFTNSYFGDPVADIPKMTIRYLENGEELAKRFLTAYMDCSATKEAFIERFRIHMLHQRVLEWGCAKAINHVTWDKDLSFSDWAERYTESATYLLN
jgi:hygromycin-B 7''-O-kinase